MMKRMILAMGFSLVLASSLLPQASPFTRGDGNLDGAFNLADAVAIVFRVFGGVPSPGCDDAMDVNNNGVMGVDDTIYALNYFFMDGPPPPSPFPECGGDGTGTSEDLLDCFQHTECDCFDQTDLDMALAGMIADEICLPVNTVVEPGLGLTVTVCPTGSAPLCGPTNVRGCPLTLTRLDADLDVDLDVSGSRVVTLLEGAIVRVPVDIDVQFFGTTSCRFTINFSARAVVPLGTEVAGPGLVRVTNVGTLGLSDVTVDIILNSGGGVCSTVLSLQDLFVDLLTAQIEEAVNMFLLDLKDDLVGIFLCM